MEGQGHSRRDLLRIAAGAAAIAPSVPALAQAPSSAVPLFFTPAEFRMLDELAEIMIPADDHSPGARAAQVAAYLDKSVAESFDEEPRKMFREGLKATNDLSRRMHGKTFLDASPEQRVAVVGRMAEKEPAPKTPEERFFGQLKGAVVFAYYTSSIGIHQEMEYKGNTMLNEFAGFDADLVPLPLPESSR